MSRSVADYIQKTSTRDVEGEATTIRPAATALFGIDSDDRYRTYSQRRTNPSFPFAFNIQKNESLLNGFFRRIALTEFRLNWTLPNISAAWGNNQMIINYSISGAAATTSTITIPDGFYSAFAISDALQSQIRSISGLSNFVVYLADQNDDSIIFQPDPALATPATFYFTPVTTSSALSPNIGVNVRQLIDMLNIPAFTTLQQTIESGVPNLRPMDYFDVVCSQLTYNQDLKDSSSALITRDALARIYMDSGTPSSSIVLNNTYSGTSTGTLTLTAVRANYPQGNVVFFTTSTSPSTAKVGDPAIITGITGGAGWNGTATVVSVDTATPFGIVVAYTNSTPTGTPTFNGTMTLYSTLVSTTVPQSTWDDRVNGVTPFVLYRQFPYPKQIRWNPAMPIGNVTFELYDDQGRSIQNLWNTAYPATSVNGTQFANSFVWNASLLISEE